jgi:hypothetical protein
MASRVGSLANIIDLIEIGHADPNHVAAKGKYAKTPIFKARTYKTVKLLLHYGADPTINIIEKENTPTKEGKSKEDTPTKEGTLISAFSHLLKYNADSVEAILDGCVSFTNQEHKNGKQLLVYDFGLFKQCTANNMNEMDLHYNVLKQGQSHLLAHPLMQIFLHLKWKQTLFYYGLNFLVYVMFVFVFTWQAFTFIHVTYCTDVEGFEGLCFKGAGDLVLCPSYNTSLRCDKKMWKTSEDTGPYSIGPILDAIEPDKAILMAWTYSKIFVHVFGVALVIRELLQCYANGFQYFWSFENLLDLFIIGLAIGFNISSQNNIELAAHLGGWSLFFAWIDLTLILGRLPFFGENIYMSINVTKALMGCLMVYVPSLMAFASAFHMFLAPSLLFDNPISSFLKVLVMMAGELEFSNFFIYHQVDKLGGRNTSVQVI